jgi:ABC transport system ATP-binding/permease protein
MAYISLKNIHISFSGSSVLKGVDLKIDKGEKICLLGRNGSGKSTLIKIILNQIKEDNGEIIRQQDLRCMALSQEVPSSQNLSIYEIVSMGLGKIGETIVAYNRIHTDLENEYSETKLKKLESLQKEIDRNNVWELMKNVDSIISKMGLNPDENFSHLSAGMKRRVMLAQALLNPPHILVLDEPTNHLDLEAIEWLEDYLIKYSGTILFVTHDRMFLQNIATRILHLDRGQISSYECDYNTYLERLQHSSEIEEKRNSEFDKVLAREEAWIRKGIKARRTRNEGRVRNLEKLRDERSKRITKTGRVNIKIRQGEKTGQNVFKIKNLCFEFGDGKKIVDGLSTTISRGDKICLLGPNGAGKSTLIKLILGELKGTNGLVEMGTNIKVSYFDQLHLQLDESLNVLQNISPNSDYVDIGGKKKHVLGYLQDFLFTPEKVKGGVAQLSGGEKNRLLLAKLFTRESNVLILDEPTNDLDVETLELLEEKLLEFSGTIIMVSHDRAFVDNIATSTFVFEGEGKIKEYFGGYSDWQRQTPVQESKVIKEKPLIPESKSKLTDVERKALHNLPKKIEELEKKSQFIKDQMAQEGFYDKGEKQIEELVSKLDALETETQEAYDYWEKLEEKS